MLTPNSSVSLVNAIKLLGHTFELCSCNHSCVQWVCSLAFPVNTAFKVFMLSIIFFYTTSLLSELIRCSQRRQNVQSDKEHILWLISYQDKVLFCDSLVLYSTDRAPHIWPFYLMSNTWAMCSCCICVRRASNSVKCPTYFVCSAKSKNLRL